MYLYTLLLHKNVITRNRDAFTAVNLNISFKSVHSVCLSKVHFKFLPYNLKIISTKCSLNYK